MFKNSLFGLVALLCFSACTSTLLVPQAGPVVNAPTTKGDAAVTVVSSIGGQALEPGRQPVVALSANGFYATGRYTYLLGAIDFYYGNSNIKEFSDPVKQKLSGLSFAPGVGLYRPMGNNVVFTANLTFPIQRELNKRDNGSDAQNTILSSINTQGQIAFAFPIAVGQRGFFSPFLGSSLFTNNKYWVTYGNNSEKGSGSDFFDAFLTTYDVGFKVGTRRVQGYAQYSLSNIVVDGETGSRGYSTFTLGLSFALGKKNKSLSPPIDLTPHTGPQPTKGF